MDGRISANFMPTHNFVGGIIDTRKRGFETTAMFGIKRILANKESSKEGFHFIETNSKSTRDFC